jgi:hypothetical protein
MPARGPAELLIVVRLLQLQIRLRDHLCLDTGVDSPTSRIHDVLLRPRILEHLQADVQQSGLG